MNRKTGFGRNLKWKPNGVAEQAQVDNAYNETSKQYAAIKSKLEEINREAKKLIAELKIETDDAKDRR